MNNFIVSLKKETDILLDELNQTETDILQKARRGVILLENTIDKMKVFITGYTFKDEHEEIMFFKDIKPRISCMLIFYRRLYYIEINRPKGGDAAQKEYLNRELGKLTHFFEENKHYYHYLRSGDCSMDAHYFLRGRPSLNTHTENFYYERDPSFSTSCDFKVSEILAHDLLESHLNIEINKLEGKNKESIENGYHNHPKVKLTWTAKKIFLIELIYALHEIGCINHGRISLKQLIVAFEHIFHVELGNVSRGLSDLRIREYPAKFLDDLKKCLMRRLNNYDNEEEI